MNTAQDVVDFLLASVGGGAQDGEHRAVRQAVIHGVREVIAARCWLWHTKTGQFLTQNVTVAVAPSGITAGSSVVELDTAAQMVAGRIIQCGGYFDDPTRIVSVNKQNNTITLDRNATRTKPTTEAVSLVMQTYYDLPQDLRDLDTLVTQTVGVLHCYISPQEWQRLEINTRGAGEPYYYTVMRSDSDPERYQVRFVGVPTNGTIVHYSYRYNPKQIKYMGYERLCRQGTVSASGTTVTGTDTAFPADVVGSVIRFGTTSTDADPVGSLAPFIHERKIVSRSGDTTLTIDAPLTAPALTRYAISDPLDVSPQMYTAVLSASEMWYARIAGKPADAAMQTYIRDIRMAFENDVVTPLAGKPSGYIYPTPRSAGWHSNLRADVE